MDPREDVEQYADNVKKGDACSFVNDKKGDAEKKGDAFSIASSDERKGDACSAVSNNLKSDNDDGTVARLRSDLLGLSTKIQELEQYKGKLETEIDKLSFESTVKIQELEQDKVKLEAKIEDIKKQVSDHVKISKEQLKENSEKTKSLEDELDTTKTMYEMLYMEYDYLDGQYQLLLKEVDKQQTLPSPDLSKTENVPCKDLAIDRKANDHVESSDGHTSVTSLKSQSSISQTAKETSDTSNYVSSYTSNFTEIGLLGKGSFAEVQEVEHHCDGKRYAVKKICLSIYMYGDSIVDGTFLREARQWSDLDPNKGIVRYITSWIEPPCSNLKQLIEQSNISNNSRQCSGSSDGVVFQTSDESDESKSTDQSDESKSTDQTDESKSTDQSNESESTDSLADTNCSFFYIQMELCEKYTLDDVIANAVDPKKASTIFIQCLSALEHIHENNLIHRDLKPSNIFFSLNGGVVKIGDFGLMKCKEPDDVTKHHSGGVGNELYRAPEQAGTNYDEKVDIYAMGLILYKMLKNFSTTSEFVSTLTKDIFNKHPEECLYDKPEIKLVRSMLATNPKMRPSATDILTGDLLRDWKKEDRD